MALYYIRSDKLKRPFSIDALFTLSWLFGAGLSLLRLSYLSVSWEYMTYLVVGLTYFVFILSFDFFRGRLMLRHKPEFSQDAFIKSVKVLNSDFLYRLTIVISCIYLVAFIFEAVKLSYIPLFTVDTPHAYSEFHVTGVHYFTVLFTFVPSLSVLYYYVSRKEEHDFRLRRIIIALLFLLSIITALLLVSRFQLLFSIILAFFTYVSYCDGKVIDLKKRRNRYLLTASILVILLLYIFITVERAHSTEYLFSIFEIKDPNIPIWIAQPYIYVANNFDNLNCLIRDLPSFTYGLRQLYPFVALTGLKFLNPSLVVGDIYITKTELTTLTFVYDAYYDFGLVGVILFSAILGYAAAFFSSMKFRKITEIAPVFHLITAQLTFYMCFSFFTTWFSNTTTWFYLGVSVIIVITDVIIRIRDKNIVFTCKKNGVHDNENK